MKTIDVKSRTWAEINLAALKHNLNYAKQTMGRKVICVLKADAYGHGAVECGKYLEKCGAFMFAVATLDEAVELREAGIKIPIMILGYTSTDYAEILCVNDIEQTVVDEAYAIELNNVAKKLGVVLKVHVALDTGMSRIGIFAQADYEKAVDAVERIYKLPNLDVVGMFTHFAVADDPNENEYTKFQYRNYCKIYSGLAERGIRIKNCHVSNSAAILNSAIHFDSVRFGICLYGMYPDSRPMPGGPLKPVMTLKSRVTQIRRLPAGVTISYGRTYKTVKPTTIAVIAAGYADGYSRRLSNNAFVVINKKKYNQVGRICMDACMAEVTNEVHVGDEVTLFGDGGMSAETVSEIVGSINYELTCLVTKRAKRVYIEE